MDMHKTKEENSGYHCIAALEAVPGRRHDRAGPKVSFSGPFSEAFRRCRSPRRRVSWQVNPDWLLSGSQTVKTARDRSLWRTNNPISGAESLNNRLRCAAAAADGGARQA
jgi:hypothetical protein